MLTGPLLPAPLNKLDVMRTEAGVIAEIATFNAGLFPAFGLPPAL